MIKFSKYEQKKEKTISRWNIKIKASQESVQIANAPFN